LDLAALDGERDLGGAVISGDDLELGADERIVEPRRDLRIDPGLPTDDQLLLEQVLGTAMRRGMPGQRQAGFAVEISSQLSLSSSKRTPFGLINLASSMPRWTSAITVPSFGALL
jgi:hypothetical protein